MKNTNFYQKIFAGFYVALVIFWVALFAMHSKEGNLNYLYSLLFGLIPFFGGLIGMFKAKLWGGFKSSLGRAVFFISLGLFLWGSGENIWSYYNFVKHVPAPYPSLADIGFAPSIFFWILGVLALSKATGALFALRKKRTAKVLAIVVPLVLLIPSYYIQVVLARGGTLVPEGETLLKVVLDIVYPFGDFLAGVIATLVFVLSFKYLGGLYRQAVIFILGGLLTMYFADSVFSYSTTEQTYYNANWGDLLLTTGLFLLTFGTLAFATNPRSRVSASAAPQPTTDESSVPVLVAESAPAPETSAVVTESPSSPESFAPPQDVSETSTPEDTQSSDEPKGEV